jgi:hypothetical protein
MVAGALRDLAGRGGDERMLLGLKGGGSSMKESTDVRDAMRRFYDGVTTGDVANFDDIVSGESANMVIGTAPGEWVTDRAGLRFGFETEGVGMRSGPDPRGWEEGSIGWVADEPTLRYPDGSEINTRLTAVLRRENGTWRLVCAHFSVGVPDEEVVGLQKKWGTQP